MARKIYALDDQLANLLQRENFQGKFDVTTFVESLSERQLNIQKQHPDEAFEPKPLIRDFEAALEKLNALKAEISDDIERNAREAQAVEAAHNKRIRQLNSRFEVFILTFGV